MVTLQQRMKGNNSDNLLGFVIGTIGTSMVVTSKIVNSTWKKFGNTKEHRHIRLKQTLMYGVGGAAAGAIFGVAGYNSIDPGLGALIGLGFGVLIGAVGSQFAKSAQAWSNKRISSAREMNLPGPLRQALNKGGEIKNNLKSRLRR